MTTTNYFSTFITMAADCPAAAGTPPGKPETVAGLQYALLRDNPYGLTSDDILFEVHAQRSGIAEADRAAARAMFFAKPMACLRASPLVKQYGWGLHHDEAGRVAAYPIGSAEYEAFAARDDLKQLSGMRNKRG